MATRVGRAFVDVILTQETVVALEARASKAVQSVFVARASALARQRRALVDVNLAVLSIESHAAEAVVRAWRDRAADARLIALGAVLAARPRIIGALDAGVVHVGEGELTGLRSGFN